MNSKTEDRKLAPIATGVIDYFPDALWAIAQLSYVGNDQHSPGTPVHWDRSKSVDEADALMRHFIERGTLDIDGMRHTAKVAWRALALLQKEIEAERLKESQDELLSDALSLGLQKRQQIKQGIINAKLDAKAARL